MCITDRVLYCEKLTPILKQDTDKVWWALSMLVDQTIGEVSALAFVAGFDVYAQPKDEPAKLLSELPELSLIHIWNCRAGVQINDSGAALGYYVSEDGYPGWMPQKWTWMPRCLLYTSIFKTVSE